MTTLRTVPSRALTTGELRHLRGLLNDAFAGGFSEADWEHALGGWHVLVDEGTQIVSHAAVVPRRLEFAGRTFEAGYVESVATLPARQRCGLGSRVMTEAATILHGEFEVGVLSTGHHRFYERLGWERWRGATYVRQPRGIVRTADEDEGIMVLRFGASEELALTDPIVCEARSGDDW